jgi:hypothetical protein
MNKRFHSEKTATGKGSVPKRHCRDMQSRQCTKIAEIGDALYAAGFTTLDEQAAALGINRSTTWTILRATHKGSGLSASIVDRMLASPELPPTVRTRIFEYTVEKRAGMYGHSKRQIRKFMEQLATGPSARRTTPHRSKRVAPR